MRKTGVLKMKKSTMTTCITIAVILVMYILFTVLSNGGYISYKMIGLLIPICVYAILAVSLNLVVGLLGELSLGHAGFLYVGAFTSAIFTQVAQNAIPNDILRFVLGMLIGAVFAALFGLLIGAAVLRLQGDYLAIVTLAFGEIIKNVLGSIFLGVDKAGLHLGLTDSALDGVDSTDVIVNGAMGISVEKISTFTIGVVLLIITVIIVMNLSDSRAGRAIKAVRDNKIAAETVGINVSKFRLLAFVISAALAGMGGALYGHNYASLTNAKFDFNFSINVLVMVVLGGMGNIPGSIIAAIVLTILPEEIRFLGNYRMVIYAVVLIVMMIFSWNPKCIEIRKAFVQRVKSIFSKKNKKEVQ